MLDSYCTGEKVALFKSTCGLITRNSISTFRHAGDGAVTAPAQDAGADRRLAFPTAAASTSPLAFPPT
jgi:hypothetical protein